jgi:cellobiose phosphorylase
MHGGIPGMLPPGRAENRKCGRFAAWLAEARRDAVRMPAAKPAPVPTFGSFSEEGTEYVVATPATPRDWYNYLWNARYVALFSHTAQGEALCQDGMGRRIPGVGGRMAFLRDRDSGAWWSLNGLPLDAPRDGWRCRHGLGFSQIEQQAHGVGSAWRCLVPREGTPRCSTAWS